MKRAFSLIELSIVILIIGILVAGVTQSSRLVSQFRLSSVRSQTQGSPVASMRNVAMWLETTSTASFDEAETENATPVTNWYDINPTSSNKINATSSGSNRPAYTLNCINSLPCLRFVNSGSDYFSYDGSFLVNTEFTIIIVEQRRSNMVGNFFLSGSGGTTNGNIILGYRYDNTITFSQFANDIDIAVSAYSSTAPLIHVFALSSTLGKRYYLNGVSKIASSAQTALVSSFATPYIGRSNISNFYYDGDIAEIIMFNRFISNEERTAIQNYLSKKWNIRIS